MKKRLLILVLLFANIVFFSCSPERSSSVVNQRDIHMPGTNDANLEEGLTYDDIKKKHYDRQSERTKKMMRESDKQSICFTRHFQILFNRIFVTYIWFYQKTI